MYASEVSCIDMKAKLSDNYAGEEMECAPCAPPRAQVCEDCEQKRPSWNVPGAAGNKYRWCAECGQKHAGAVKVKVTVQSKCERGPPGMLVVLKTMVLTKTLKPPCDDPNTQRWSRPRTRKP